MSDESNFYGGFQIKELTNEFMDARSNFLRTGENALELPSAARRYQAALDGAIVPFENEERRHQSTRAVPGTAEGLEDRKRYVQNTLEWMRAERASVTRLISTLAQGDDSSSHPAPQ